VIIIAGTKENKKALSSSDISEEIRMFNSAKTADARDRARAVKNFTLYAPTDNWDIWDATSANTLRSEGRTPSYYNFLQMYVEGNAGNFILNKVDPDFIDNDVDDVDVSETLYALKKVYFSDKDHFDYDASYTSAVVNGCIYRGVEEIKIARTIDEPRGRIYFESLTPTSVIFEPSNLTDDIARGSRNAFKRFYLFPKDIIRLFPNAEADVKSSILQREQPEQYVETRSIPQENMWGRQYEVVEHYHIEQEYKEVAYDQVNCVRLPDTEFEFGSQDDFYAKVSWAQGEGFELEAESIKVIKVPTEALYVTTFIQALGVVLENRRDERQIIDSKGNAHLPFFTWSYITKVGKSIGLIDLGKDMQNDINKREAQKSKILEQTPIGDKTIIHDLAFDGDDRKYQTILDEFTDSSKPLRLSENAPLGVPLIEKLRGSQLNPAIMQDESAKISMMDRILRLPPAMQGLQGKSGTSGILFGRQVIEGNVMQKVPSTTLEQYQNYKFEAWLSLAIKLYGGESQIEREANYDRSFRRVDGSEITLNKFIGIDADGRDIVKNDISKLKTVNVIISKTKDNDYSKQAKRETDVALLQAMVPSATNTGIRAIVEADLAKSIDGMPQDQKELTEKMSNLTVELAMKTLVLQNAQLDAQIAQAQQSQEAPQAPPITGGRGGKGDMSGIESLGAANNMESLEQKKADSYPERPVAPQG